MHRLRSFLAVGLGMALLSAAARGDECSACCLTESGNPDLKSAGPLAFGPDGILFVADTQGAAIFAINTNDRIPGSTEGTLSVEGIDSKIAALLGASPREIMINDMAVNPISGRVYLSVSRGRGPAAAPVLMRVDRAGKVEEFTLDNIPFAKTSLPNAPESAQGGRGGDPRAESITDLAYVDGRLYVAGLSNEQFSSRLLAIPFPFKDKADGASVEIYHGSHGRFETKSPVRTFTVYRLKGDPYLLAAYTCTPLVKIPVAELKAGAHVKGTTIAELGNRNKPLDMIVYQKGGKDYLLLANNSRGVMKIATEGADSAQSITAPIHDKAGMPYETIAELKGVMQLDQLDKEHAVVLARSNSGSLNLESVVLP